MVGILLLPSHHSSIHQCENILNLILATNEWLSVEHHGLERAAPIVELLDWHQSVERAAPIVEPLDGHQNVELALAIDGLHTIESHCLDPSQPMADSGPLLVEVERKLVREISGSPGTRVEVVPVDFPMGPPWEPCWQMTVVNFDDPQGPYRVVRSL